MDISVVIPLLDEQDSLVELHDWIAQVMQSNQLTYELIFIDDGSTDGSWEVIESLSKKNPHVKAIRFYKNFGKSQALHAGFKETKGEVVITMDADLQDSPDEVPDRDDGRAGGPREAEALHSSHPCRRAPRPRYEARSVGCPTLLPSCPTESARCGRRTSW